MTTYVLSQRTTELNDSTGDLSGLALVPVTPQNPEESALHLLASGPQGLNADGP